MSYSKAKISADVRRNQTVGSLLFSTAQNHLFVGRRAARLLTA